jgi:D-hydroxyproline dehydrogenase subunit alpha
MPISRSDPARSGARSAAATVLVVGAGPAGLAAAVAAAEVGAHVVLIDAEAAPGGQFWRHRRGGAVAAPLHHLADEYRSLAGRLQALRVDGRLEYLARHQVWAVEPFDDGFAVHLTDRRARTPVAVQRTAVRLVLVPGAYDLQVPFPGWDLPGVLTAGGAQALLKEHGVVAGRRVLIAGTGPFLLPVAAGLAAAGARVVGVHDAAGLIGGTRMPLAIAAHPSKAIEAAGYFATLLRRRVPYRTRSTVVAAHGDTAVESVAVAPLDGHGRPRADKVTRVEVDTLAVGWGFVPQLELPLALGCAIGPGPDGRPVIAVDADQQTSVPWVFVAGEACGVGGAEKALVEGRIAGIAAAATTPPEIPARLAKRRASLRRFAAAVASAYPVPDAWQHGLTDDTLVCRCEEVSVGTLRTAVEAHGIADARAAKLQVRTGMGWCQGRVCGYAVSCLTAAWSGAEPTFDPGTRPIAQPVSLALVAAGLPPVDQ